MQRKIATLIATLFAILTQPLQAESPDFDFSTCNFGGTIYDSSVSVVGNRIVYIGADHSIKLTLKRKAQQIECADTDADGIDEIVSYSSGGARAITTVRKTKRASLATYCKRIRTLTRGEIWKSRASDHINDQRKLSTSFITLRSTGAPKNNCLYVYDKKGNLVHKLGRYFPTGTAYSSRYYGGHGCGDLRSAATVAGMARSKTGSAEGYVTSGTGNCVKIPNLNACFNSSGC